MPVPILTLPAQPRFQTLRWRLVSNTGIAQSPLNGSTQTFEWPGAAWGCDVVLPPMKRAVAAPWQAFFIACRGMSGRFYLHDHFGETPRGAGGGTPRVNGASQLGVALVTDGWPASTAVLKVGDWFAYDLPDGSRQLHLLTADATSNGSGQATLAFEPPLRQSPADNAALIVSAASCIMGLTTDDIGWDISTAQNYGFAFSAIERFYLP